MPDIAALTATLGSIKHATEIARLIKDSKLSLSDAENRLKFADMLDALADSKIHISELKELIEKKDKEITELRKSLALGEELKFSGKFYEQKGDPTPFCPRCWEKDKIAIHLAPETTRDWAYWRSCPQCKAEYRIRDVQYST